MTLPLREKLMCCAKERDDKWGEVVLGRLESCNDLVAEEDVYHSACMTKFRLKRQNDTMRGKPVNNILLDGFMSVCGWLEKEGDCELHTIIEIQEKMRDTSAGEAYSSVYMKKKVKRTIQ